MRGHRSDYEVRRVLGVGAMSLVWEGLAHVSGQVVAIKEPLPADSAPSRAALRREAVLLDRVRHPSLAGLVEPIFDGRGAVCALVLERAPGESLAGRLREGPMSAMEVFALTLGLGEALTALHGAGVVHGDVKPANVVFEGDPAPKATLVDLGESFDLRGEVEPPLPMSGAGPASGALPYLAPERVEGRPVGPPADVYGFALVVAEALLGAPVFAGSSATVVQTTRQRSAPGLPLAHRYAPLRSVLERALTPAPEDRPSLSWLRSRMGEAWAVILGSLPSGR